MQLIRRDMDYDLELCSVHFSEEQFKAIDHILPTKLYIYIVTSLVWPVTFDR
jgi:hypothetical protein